MILCVLAVIAFILLASASNSSLLSTDTGLSPALSWVSQLLP